MAWHQISIVTDEASAHTLADFLTEIGAVSVTFMDAENEPVYEPPLNAVKVWQKTRVVALFDLVAHPAVIRAMITYELKTVIQQSWRQEVLEDQEWERTWLEHFKPMLFGHKLWVCPTGMEQQTPDTVCMTLDPGLAFGTGTHSTTALCLEWLASHDLQGKTVIDFGCGSGILAIAALLLGAREAHAIDIDPQALTATQANSEKNNVQDRLRYYLPEEFKGGPADVVVANILAAPLIDRSQAISDMVRLGGNLILSGILTEQAEAVCAAYEPFVHFSVPFINQAEWCRLDGEKAV